MTRDEATKYLIDISYKFGNISVEYLTEKDGEKMREAINVLTNEQQTCEDAVSREAVLGLFAQNADAVRPFSKTWEEVKALPSVNPQPICEERDMQDELISRRAVQIELKNCKVVDMYDENDNFVGYYNADTVDSIIRNLPSVKPQPKWIPVSEKMPKGSDIVLLSLPPHIDPDGEECSASVICGHYIGGINKEWGLSDGDTFGYGIVSIRKGTNPIAWMPLPELYTAEKEETHG